MTTPYATIAEADVFNSGNATWDAATGTQKTAALVNARRYIDKHYSCKSIDMLDVPDNVVEASAKLALSDMTTSLYSVSPSSVSVKSKSAGAGSAKTSKTYAGSNTTLTDPFPEVTFILGGTCTVIKSGGISSVTAGRA